MFDELASKLAATLQRLTGRGVLSEDAVREGLREIRRILLEADVSFELTREFLERVEAKAVKEMAGLTWLLSGATVRFFKRFRAIRLGFVVLPWSSQPSKLPGSRALHASANRAATKRGAANVLHAVH